MKIDQFEPKEPALQKYVDYYYILSTVGDEHNTTYLAFPSCRTPVGFFWNGMTEHGADGIMVRAFPGETLPCSMVGNFLKPLKIAFEPGVVEFSIVFKPLGINYFVPDKLGPLMGSDVSPTNRFDDLFAPVQKLIVGGANNLGELENRLVSRIQTSRPIEILESVIGRFQDPEVNERQLAEGLDISGKQLFRLFKDHLGVNPTQYRHLLRFRQAMETSLKALKPNLTDIGHTAGYYDQPHFIREFRKITNQTPREFLGRISDETKDRIVWQFFDDVSDSYK